jgi:hypothetical protein
MNDQTALVYAFRKKNSGEVYLIIRDKNEPRGIRDFTQYSCKLETYRRCVCGVNIFNINEQDRLNFMRFNKYSPAYNWYIEVKRVHEEEEMPLENGLYIYND